MNLHSLSESVSELLEYGRMERYNTVEVENGLSWLLKGHFQEFHFCLDVIV